MKIFTYSMFLGAMMTCTSLYAVDTPATLEGATVVKAEEVKDLMSKGVPVFDTRVKAEFAEEHIKGAVSLPYKEKSKKEVGFDTAADEFDDSKLPAEKMIFQCNGPECWKSYKASAWAMKKGKKSVYWFRGGIPEWKTRAFPTEK